MQKIKDEIIGLFFEMAGVSAFAAVLYLMTLFFMR
ncbi:hypothetical protein SDC9_166857 [bioreactor metagenome]|uniref:Uncharacterized protein n=1 Tax=bioreactor metagenome TaxID=1076179 RepID=A0A645FY62_9ZZZZ